MKARMLITTLLVVMLLAIVSSVVYADDGETWLDSPVEGASRCGSPFGQSNPLGGQAFHNAADMACGMYRAPVRAVASGEVVWDGYWPIGVGGPATGHGLTMVIFHPESGLYTYSAHLDDVTMHVGDQVSKGETVGHVGNSGYVQKFVGNPNYHLHFAVRNTGPEDGSCWNTSCWKNPDDYLGTAPSGTVASGDSEDKNQGGGQVEVTPSPDDSESPSTNEPKETNTTVGSSGLVATLDRIANAIRLIPELRVYAETWDKYKKYLPWLSAILVVLLFLTVFQPLVGWLGKTRWGRKYDRKRKQFFWLSVVILVAYSIRKDGGTEDLLLLQMLKFTSGIWAFFTVTNFVYGLWRHFNYDPELEKVLAAGGHDKWEWLREAVLTPVIYGVLASILAFSFGYYWFRPVVVTAEEQSPPAEESSPVVINPEPTPQEPHAPPPSGNGRIDFNCDFNAIEAGLGPVEVSCDDNGYPKFSIRYWNGSYVSFHIDAEVLDAAAAASPDNLDLILVSIAVAHSESSGYQNSVCSGAGACGTWQFMPGTFMAYAPLGSSLDDRFNRFIEGKAAANLLGDGANGYGGMQLYAKSGAEFTNCFQGVGCPTWNQHGPQADYVLRLFTALRVAAGLE